MPMTKAELQEAYPEILAEIEQSAYKRGQDDGYAKGTKEGFEKGANAERERIKAVEGVIAKSETPNNPDLASMKYDGKTTSSEAALKAIEFGFAFRENKKQAFKEDSPPAVATVEAPPDTEVKKGFMDLVDGYQKEKDCTRTEAIKAVVKDNPASHKEYLMSLKPKKEE